MFNTLKILFTNTHFRTVGLIFAVNSIMFGSWITRLPDVQNRLELSEGALGLALLGLPLGSIAIMPFMGWIIHRLGDGKTTLISGLIYCLASTLPVLAPNYVLLLAALTLTGLSTGAMDIAMNASAAAVEARYGRVIMSACHGMWSVGGMIGAGTTSLLAGFGVPAGSHIVVLGFLLLFIVLIHSRSLRSIREETVSDVIFSLPSGPLVGIAVIGFCIMLGEGAIADWSAVYLKNTLGADAFYSGLGYAGFSLTMAIGRFYGDRIIASWGTRSLVITGTVIGITGISTGLLLQTPLFVVVGFTVAGLGYSCLIPAVYSSAARMPGRTSGASIAAVAGMGYLGMLIGPPLIGLVAEGFGLTIGMGTVVLLLAIALALATRVRFR